MRVLIACFFLSAPVQDAPSPPEDGPLYRTVELRRGESAEVELWNGRKASVKLLDLGERRDPWVQVEINGEAIRLGSGRDRLPTAVADVQIDCPVTRAWAVDAWGLLKDARFRIWPAGSPWERPGRFVYPARQRWSARSAHEPAGLEISGCEGLVDGLAVADGFIVGARGEIQPEHKDAIREFGADDVLIRDTRGWYHHSARFHAIDPSVKLGRKVYRGQKLGTLGSRLHVDMRRREADGRWVLEDPYAFLWEAYRREHGQGILAVARPHSLIRSGDTATLDGTRSWSVSKIVRYEWTFGDGTSAEGARVDRIYPKPGTYTETLTVTDAAGRVSTDFGVVSVSDRENPKADPPTIHAACAPTFGIQPGDPVTFKVRRFGSAHGDETWDFGDGTPPRASDGTATTTHAFAKAGRYLVKVAAADASTARLQVFVGERPRATKPFGGKFRVIPGRIEAEDYDEGEPGVAYEDAEAKNLGADYRGKVGVDIEPRAEASGGFNLGWTRPGEWTAYTVDVRESGLYDVDIPVACLQKGGTFHLEFDGKDVSGPIQVPDTGAWEIMKPMRHPGVRLSAGTYVMKVRLDTPGERGSIGDLDYFEFVKRP